MAQTSARGWLWTVFAAAACSPYAGQSRVLAGEDSPPTDVQDPPITDDRTPTDNGWPRTISAGKTEITVYQPQVESWESNRMHSRAAVSIRTAESALPVFGVIWLSARTDVDRENRLVALNDIQVERGSFPSRPDQAEELTSTVRQHLRTGGVYVALDRLEASLAVTRVESKHPKVQVRNDVPKILFSTTPAVLVLIDGQPVLRSVAGTSLLRVINTRALLLLAPRTGRYYFFMGGQWMTSTSPTGPWVAESEMGGSLALDLDRAREATAREGLVDLLQTSGTPLEDALARGLKPAVFTSTSAAELIQTDGAPKLEPISGTRLLEVTNSMSDIFMNTADQEYYVLLSGRWYRSPSLERGPWGFVPAKSLPADFAQIPENHPRGTVLASVPGTPESQEAIIANEIPQTARIDRRAAQLNVSYDGTPQWSTIEGTSLAYAPNSASPVIRVDPAHYYAVEGGVWFTASSPSGPWATATYVPETIYNIPPSSPVYNVTYVHVYDSTPDAVYEGYTPGYLGSYVTDDDVVVYGTGYVYPCWAEAVWIGSPWTFGFDVGWAPGFYWGFGWGYGVGLGIGYWPGMLFHPWWGPAGWGWGRRNVAVHNYHDANLYRSAWGRSVTGSDWERHAEGNRAAMPAQREGAVGHVYAGHDGQVYRTTPSGEWERNTGAGWQRSSPTRDLGRENKGRKLGGAHWQIFREGGGFRGGGFHGGGGRR